MPTPKRTTTPTSSAGLHWQTTDDGSRTLWDERRNETYHSCGGAVAESLSVYLRHSGIHQRLKRGQASSVLEYGFGTATAFLLTAADAILHGTGLHYRALELHLLPAAILAELKLSDSVIAMADRAEFGDVLALAQALLDELVLWRAGLPLAVPPGTYHVAIGLEVELELIVIDALAYDTEEGVTFDAVYFDPFSPATCPELWTESVFRIAYQSLCAGGSLTSYCVKGSVRRGLEAVGFDVHKLPSPLAGKREVLLALKGSGLFFSERTALAL